MIVGNPRSKPTNCLLKCIKNPKYKSFFFAMGLIAIILNQEQIEINKIKTLCPDEG